MVYAYRPFSADYDYTHTLHKHKKFEIFDKYILIVFNIK